MDHYAITHHINSSLYRKLSFARKGNRVYGWKIVLIRALHVMHCVSFRAKKKKNRLYGSHGISYMRARAGDTVHYTYYPRSLPILYRKLTEIEKKNLSQNNAIVRFVRRVGRVQLFSCRKNMSIAWKKSI